MFRRLAIAIVIALGTLFTISIVSTAIAVVRPEWLHPTPAVAEEEPVNLATLPWLLSKLSMVPAGPVQKTIIAVMIENSHAARPYQAGLNQALAVLEMQVEGGISRFSVLFDKDVLPERAGPVRSLRLYFLEGIEHWSSLLLFAGGSPEALEEAPQASIPALNGLGRPKNFTRDNDIPAPHNLFIDAENMRSIADEFELGTVGWPPYVVGSAMEGDAASVVHLNFLSTDHNVTYTAHGRTYERENGGEMTDASPANVVVIETPIASIGEIGRLDIPMISGKMLLFRSGSVYHGRWKIDANGFTFLAEDGTPLRFAWGLTWITGLPTLDRVTWE